MAERLAYWNYLKACGLCKHKKISKLGQNVMISISGGWFYSGDAIMSSSVAVGF